MRWQGARRSRNIEDRRGMRVGPRGMGMGIGGLLLLMLVGFLVGGDPLALLNGTGPSVGVQPAPQSGPTGAPADPHGEFISAVLADTEDTWGTLFSRMNRRYEEPPLVLFTDQVQSACGFASAAVGPFYCPADSKVYLDLGFFRELDQRFGAPGDFAQAYVVAHEVGHHVQNLLGIAERAHRLRSRLSEADANALSVRQELQADCYAGVWGHYSAARGEAAPDKVTLERGDLEEGLRAAAAIGDDMMQRRAQGYVVPESWTHGSSEQRVTWFRRGLESGRLEGCDTFQQGS
jgi:uncharacterized protein